ncbi:hypothetical protein ACJJIE_03935 [Microbulbifer sp. TRSA001]|uniref:hypothetical protein n=1 Tax=unclassified Microbulbifer TaxID=2619833 RepID=UPI0024AE5632|nr:hypothetical protein [Microbulbifer sp. VAAF005]WHI46605.1 hypothetical protein P0078_23340 [Microbulbifer sp. VAAF005]
MSKSTSIEQCEDFLKREKEYNLKNKIWPSVNVVIDRLLERSHEMSAVYEELAKKYPLEVTHKFLDIFLTTVVFWSPKEANKHREQKKQLGRLNAEIGELANKLASLLSERRELSDSSDFNVSSHFCIVNVIDNASRHNGHYTGFLRGPLRSLKGQYDLKYWPSLSEVVSEISVDAHSAEVAPRSSQTIAAISSQRPSTADFFRALLAAIDENSTGFDRQLPKGFKLSDCALSIIANCALALDPEELTVSSTVKGIRQRLRNSN